MAEPTPDRDDERLERSAMPRWVPLLIGAVLVTLAALAVYTGLRYRDGDTLTEQVAPRSQRTSGSAPPGAPGAGASLVLPGASGENTPTANAPVTGSSRAIVTGGPAGVQAQVRIWARRGMVLNVLPEDSVVHVNELPIGHVRQFNSMDEVYDFAEPGSYNVRIVAPGGAEKTFVVTVAEDAQLEVARISAQLQ